MDKIAILASDLDAQKDEKETEFVIKNVIIYYVNGMVVIVQIDVQKDVLHPWSVMEFVKKNVTMINVIMMEMIANNYVLVDVLFYD